MSDKKTRKGTEYSALFLAKSASDFRNYFTILQTEMLLFPRVK